MEHVEYEMGLEPLVCGSVRSGLEAQCQEHGIFRTFSLLFPRLFACVVPSTFFSLSFTLQEKTIRVLLIP